MLRYCMNVTLLVEKTGFIELSQWKLTISWLICMFCSCKNLTKTQSCASVPPGAGGHQEEGGEAEEENQWARGGQWGHSDGSTSASSPSQTCPDPTGRWGPEDAGGDAGGDDAGAAEEGEWGGEGGVCQPAAHCGLRLRTGRRGSEHLWMGVTVLCVCVL